MVVPELEQEFVIPEGVTVELEGKVLTVKGPKGTLSREFGDRDIQLSVNDSRILMSSRFLSTRKVAIFGMYGATIKNLIRGVTRGYRARLRVVSSHFPITTEIREGQVLINNFIGERYPRRARVYEGVTVAVEGEFITVSGIDRDSVAQTAANIEQATIVRHRDRRIFQDGVYRVSKAAMVEE